MTRTLFTADRVDTADAVWSPGFVEVDDETVVAVGPWEARASDAGRSDPRPRSEDDVLRERQPGVLRERQPGGLRERQPSRDPGDEDATASGYESRPVQHEHLDGTVLPGFIDQHVHGALGVDFGSASEADVIRAVDFHAARGSTRLVASIATAPLESLARAVEILSPLVASGVLAGIHLEGPYLSAARRGAHDPALLRTPSWPELADLLDRGDGGIRMVTIAPELPGALDVISSLVERGVTVALGHSDADYATAVAGIERGATVATHLFNGMRPLHHRDPGLVGAALDDERVTVEPILDGHHVAASVAELVRRCAPRRLALVSDAMSATGLGDGTYTIAGSPVVVTDGVAMLADGSSLAGSTATVADGLARMSSAHRLSDSDAVAVSSASATRALGLSNTGLAPGARADLVLVDDAWRVQRVLRAGTWLPPAA